MKYTEKFNLKKPDPDDFYNIADFNDNTDIIDENLKTAFEKANAALPSDSYTAADVLSKLKTVDGSGSGLDADLFKGQSIIPAANGGTGAATLSDFIKIKSVTSTDINDITEAGMYAMGNAYANCPADWSVLPVFRAGGDAAQFCLPVLTDEFYYRAVNVGGTWRPWKKIIDSKNLAASVQSLFTGGSISVIRQIIKGTIVLPSTADNVSATVSLTNAAKAYVVINGSGNVSGEFGVVPYLVSLTTAAITLRNNTGASFVASYQIVEFY